MAPGKNDKAKAQDRNKISPNLYKLGGPKSSDLGILKFRGMRVRGSGQGTRNTSGEISHQIGLDTDGGNHELRGRDNAGRKVKTKNRMKRRNSFTGKGEETKRPIDEIGAGGGRDARREGLCTGFSGARDGEVVGEDQKSVGKRGIGTNGRPCR
jgi:hypothetical protein